MSHDQRSRDSRKLCLKLPERETTMSSSPAVPSITNNSIKHQSFVYTIKWSNRSISNNSILHKSFVCTLLESSIWPIDRTLLSDSTSGESGLGSNSNEEVLDIPQSSSITGASLSDCLVPYPEHSLGESCHSAQVIGRVNTPLSFFLYPFFLPFFLSTLYTSKHRLTAISVHCSSRGLVNIHNIF